METQDALLSETGLSIRTYRRLTLAGYERLSQLDGVNEDTLMDIPGFGIRCLRELRNQLSQYGYKLQPGKTCRDTWQVPDGTRRRIRRLYQNGASLREVSDQTGVSVVTVRLILDEAGLTRSHDEAMRLRQVRERERREQELLEQLAAEVKAAYMSAPEVSQELGLDKSHVCALCRGGAFPGAFRLGALPQSPWLIPRTSAAAYGERRKRADARTSD